MKRVLIFEKSVEEVAAVMAKLAMTGNMYEVAGFTDPDEFENAVSDLGSVDLFITSWGQDGVSDKLQRIAPDAVTLFLEEEAQEVRDDLPRQVFLSKPYDGDAFTAALQRAEARLHHLSPTPPIISTRSGGGYTGKVEGIRLFDLVQLYLMSHLSGRLLLEFETSVKGWLRLHAGKIIDGAYAELRGETAVIAMFGHTEGTFRFERSQTLEVPATAIDIGWEQLIMKALMSADEAKQSNSTPVHAD